MVDVDDSEEEDSPSLDEESVTELVWLTAELWLLGVVAEEDGVELSLLGVAAEEDGVEPVVVDELDLSLVDVVDVVPDGALAEVMADAEEGRPETAVDGVDDALDGLAEAPLVAPEGALPAPHVHASYVPLSLQSCTPTVTPAAPHSHAWVEPGTQAGVMVEAGEPPHAAARIAVRNIQGVGEGRIDGAS